VLGDGSGVYTSVFGATGFKHLFCVYNTLTCSAGQFAGTTCNSFNHLIKRPLGTSSNFEYSVCALHTPAGAPKPTIHNLPYISHAPGQQRHDCRHLDRRRDPHSRHVPLASAVPEPAKDEGKKKK